MDAEHRVVPGGHLGHSVRGTCTVPPGEGAACNPSATYPCQWLDQFCDVPAANGTTATCTKRLALGADCRSTQFILARGCPFDGHCAGDSAAPVAAGVDCGAS